MAATALACPTPLPTPPTLAASPRQPTQPTQLRQPTQPTQPPAHARGHTRGHAEVGGVMCSLSNSVSRERGQWRETATARAREQAGTRSPGERHPHAALSTCSQLGSHADAATTHQTPAHTCDSSPPNLVAIHTFGNNKKRTISRNGLIIVQGIGGEADSEERCATDARLPIFSAPFASPIAPPHNPTHALATAP